MSVGCALNFCSTVDGLTWEECQGRFVIRAAPRRNSYS